MKFLIFIAVTRRPLSADSGVSSRSKFVLRCRLWRHTVVDAHSEGADWQKKAKWTAFFVRCPPPHPAIIPTPPSR